MAGLRDVVQGLATREGVEAVIVVSPDGLPIDQVTRNGLDPDELSALAVTLMHGAERLGAAARCAEFSTAVLEFGERMAIVSGLGGDNLLFVLSTPRSNIGSLLYDLRRHAPALAALL